MKNYTVLGTLQPTVIEFLKAEIMNRRRDVPGFQRVEFDSDLLAYMQELFINKELKVQRTIDNTRQVQKAFYTTDGTIYPIHRDGLRCKSALNIAVECNDTDWVRWYNDDVISSLSDAVSMIGANGAATRNTTIEDIESVPYVEQYVPKPGEVYVLDVETFHTWRCKGPKPRIILQTKFEGFPSYTDLKRSLQRASFANLVSQ